MRTTYSLLPLHTIIRSLRGLWSGTSTINGYSTLAALASDLPPETKSKCNQLGIVTGTIQALNWSGATLWMFVNGADEHIFELFSKVYMSRILVTLGDDKVSKRRENVAHVVNTKVIRMHSPISSFFTFNMPSSMTPSISYLKRSCSCRMLQPYQVPLAVPVFQYSAFFVL